MLARDAGFVSPKTKKLDVIEGYTFGSLHRKCKRFRGGGRGVLPYLKRLFGNTSFLNCPLSFVCVTPSFGNTNPSEFIDVRSNPSNDT